jgi:hypothetical protein
MEQDDAKDNEELLAAESRLRRRAGGVRKSKHASRCYTSELPQMGEYKMKVS